MTPQFLILIGVLAIISSKITLDKPRQQGETAVSALVGFALAVGGFAWWIVPALA